MGHNYIGNNYKERAGSEALIRNCSARNNTAIGGREVRGGFLHTIAPASVTVIDSTMHGNQARGFGSDRELWGLAAASQGQEQQTEHARGGAFSIQADSSSVSLTLLSSTIIDNHALAGQFSSCARMHVHACMCTCTAHIHTLTCMPTVQGRCSAAAGQRHWHCHKHHPPV